MLRIIRDNTLWNIIEDSKKYKMILYSDKMYVKSLYDIFRCIDVNVDYSIIDDGEEYNKNIYELLLENIDEIMIIVAKNNFPKAKSILEGMGFVLGLNFKNIERYVVETIAAPYYYDPMLGYNLYTGDEETNGFRIYGNLNDEGLRIITLGGSTSDPYMYPFKSWSAWLHELLTESEVTNTVICGAVAGYDSFGELLKFIRDGIYFKPDLVINFNGYNDMVIEHEYPYINDYMRSISTYLNKVNSKINSMFNSNSFGVTWGIKGNFAGSVEDCYKFWLDNNRMIHAICDAWGINHLTFIQPGLCNGKKKLASYEERYLINAGLVGQERRPITVYAKRMKEFERIAEEGEKQYEWIKNLTSIFGDSEVYIDRVHVNEQGNKIIAENIMACVMKYIKK